MICVILLHEGLWRWLLGLVLCWKLEVLCCCIWSFLGLDVFDLGLISPVILDVAFRQKVSEFVFFLHILQKLRQNYLVFFIFRCLSPYHICYFAGELLFWPLSRNDVVEGAIDFPKLHRRVFVKALVLHIGQNSFQHFDKIYYI